MSVGLATMGKYVPMFNRGGATPRIFQEDVPRPTLLVTSVEYVKRKDEDNRPIKIIIKDVQ